MTAPRIEPYRVAAYNTSRSSENQIHDDSVARKFGFTGGLVPGVDVYGYMAHLPVGRWGRAWLERGTMTCRLAKPVYDGENATVTASGTDNELTIEVASRGALCATGAATLLDEPANPPSPNNYEVVPPPDERPPASDASLPVGRWLNSDPLLLTAGFNAQYLRDLRETELLYASDSLAHPGLLLRLCNWALSHNVVLGPWIHVGSTVRYFDVARVGETLTTRARIAGNDERKGHRFVDLDTLVLADGRPVAHVLHTAIWRPRQLQAA